MDIRIRIAANTDVAAITDIYNQAIALGNATAHTTPVTAVERSAWLAEHNPDIEPVHVAESSGQVVGYSSLSGYRPGRTALRHTKELSYFVHKNYRGQGIGSALVKHAIAQCPALDIKALFAILLDNNPTSVALLKKYDFEKWGHMPAVADFAGTEVGHLYYGRRV